MTATDMSPGASSSRVASGGGASGTDEPAPAQGLPPKPSTGRDEPEVRLHLPALPRFLRIARLTAAGLAGDLGFGVESIEDLRVAVDELCAAIIDGTSADAELSLSFRESGGGLVIEGSCQGRTENPPQLDEVARELLTILADEYHLGGIGTDRSFRLVKRPQP